VEGGGDRRVDVKSVCMSSFFVCAIAPIFVFVPVPTLSLSSLPSSPSKSLHALAPLVPPTRKWGGWQLRIPGFGFKPPSTRTRR
jgi:hypothetical protein